MKNISSVLLLVLLCCSNAFPRRPLDCAVPNLMNGFNFDLQKVITEKDNDNLVFSPYSIYSVLAMLSLGANKTTKEQITSALKWKPGEDHWTAISLMRQSFERDDSNVESKLDVANKGWLSKGMKVLDEFHNTMEDIFGVGFEEEDFNNPAHARDNINQWVSDHTGARIPELFPPNSFDSMTRMVLANAVYFKGQWKIPFKERYTKPGKFIREDGSDTDGVEYMYLSDTFQTGVHRNVELLELPYGNDGKYSMLFAKPRNVREMFGYVDEVNDFVNMTRLSKELDEPLMKKFMNSLSRTKYDIYVPKFTIKKAINLIDALKGLKITDVFSSQQSDLSKITGNRELFVSSAQHKAFIQVDEQGTVAGAATGLGISFMSMPPSLKLNRPFLFFILNKRCNSIIFSGKVMDPSQ